MRLPLTVRRKLPMPASNRADREEARNADEAVSKSLVAACQHGDAEAFRQLYDLCHRRVYRLAARMVGLQDAADVTQQVFLQIFRSIGQFSGKSRFETWLFRLTVNESLQHFRRDRRRPHQMLDRDIQDRSQSDRQDTVREELEIALTRIDADLRTIFLLKEVEGLSYADIAATLDLPEGTVGSRLNRARRELRQQLLDLGIDPP
jgi:RNA polymerase sigma-70 factor (ECF subfamily)